MNINDLYDSIILTENLAQENYNNRNSVVDCGLPGVCNHYFPIFDLNYNRTGEVCMSAKLSKTIKGHMRYTYQINGKRIAKKYIVSEMHLLGALAN